MAGRNGNSRGGVRAAAALGAAIALGLAAVAMNAARGTALAGAGPARAQWVLLAFGIVVLAVPLAIRVRRSQDAVSGPTPTQSRISGLVVPGFVLMGLVTFIALAVLGTRGMHIPPPQQPQGISAPGSGATHVPTDVPTIGTGGQPVQPSTSGSSPISFKDLLLGFLILLGAGAIILLAVLLTRWLMARRRTAREDEGVVDGGIDGDGTEEALADAVQAGRQALGDDPDPRTAIIACYAAMEKSLAEGGVSRRKADTPTDLLQRAVDAELVQGGAARTLTELFTEARYSTHPVGEHQRDQARAALEDISAHLAAAAAAADARYGEREEIEI